MTLDKDEMRLLMEVVDRRLEDLDHIWPSLFSCQLADVVPFMEHEYETASLERISKKLKKLIDES